MTLKDYYEDYMKVNQLLLDEQQQLVQEFINLRHAMAAGVAGAAMMSPMKQKQEPTPPPQAPKPEVAHVLPAPKPVNPKQQKMAQAITRKYDIDDQLAQEIVEIAHKYEKPNFPTAKDILAVVGIESSFDPDAVSGLRKDPAVGLMQVRPKVWGMSAADLSDIESQIKTGSDILQLYYKKLRNKEAAIAAYNVGMSEYRNGNNAEGYVSKYMHELKLYAGL
jgi:hypothetical protein